MSYAVRCATRLWKVSLRRKCLGGKITHVVHSGRGGAGPAWTKPTFSCQELPCLLPCCGSSRMRHGWGARLQPGRRAGERACHSAPGLARACSCPQPGLSHLLSAPLEEAPVQGPVLNIRGGVFLEECSVMGSSVSEKAGLLHRCCRQGPQRRGGIRGLRPSRAGRSSKPRLEWPVLRGHTCCCISSRWAGTGSP